MAARLLVFPDLVAGLLVQGEQELPWARPAPEDDQVAIKYRRRGVAPDVAQLAEVVVPQLLAAEVIAVQARRAEADGHALAVRGGAGGGIGVGGVGRLVGRVGDDL